MSDANRKTGGEASGAERKPPPAATWGRFVISGVLIITVLLGVVYLIVQSNAFFKAVVLPRIATAGGLDIAVDQVSFSPFSGVRGTRLVLGPQGGETLLRSDSFRVRYDLFGLLAGKIRLDELKASGLEVTIVGSGDGSSNLMKLIDGFGGADSRDEATPAFEIKDVKIENGQVLWRDAAGSGVAGEKLAFRAVNISLDRLAPGQTGRLSISATMKAAPSIEDSYQATFRGAMTVGLAETLLPRVLKGSVDFTVDQAQGAFADLAQVEANLSVDLRPGDLKEFRFQFRKEGRPLGSASARGPLDLERLEGRVALAIEGVDRRILDLLGAPFDLRFGATKLAATGQVELSAGGNNLTAQLDLDGKQVEIRCGDRQTPAIDLKLGLACALDSAKQRFVIRRFDLEGFQNQERRLHGELDRPVLLKWNAAATGTRGPSLFLSVTNLDLGEWRTCLGASFPEGTLSAGLHLTFEKEGQMSRGKLVGKVQGFEFGLDATHKIQGDLDLKMSGFLEGYDHANLNRFDLDLARGGKSIFSSHGSVSYRLDNGEWIVQTSLDGSLPSLARLWNLPQWVCDAGRFEFRLRYLDRNQTQTADMHLDVDRFSGRLGSVPFSEFTLSGASEVRRSGDQLELRNTEFGFKRGFDSAGRVTLSGRYAESAGTGRVEWHSQGLNGIALRPFLVPYLGDHPLKGIPVNLDGTLEWNPTQENHLTASLALDNLPGEAADRDRPLSAKANLDVAWNARTVHLKKAKVNLSPTERAGNEIDLSAELALDQWEKLSGQIQVDSSSVDLTPFARFFAAHAVSKTPPPAAETSSGTWAPLDLPVRDLGLELSFRRFFYREIESSNLLMNATLRTNRLAVSPFEFSVVDRPVSLRGEVDLAKPGLGYDLALDLPRTPIEPFFNTLQPEKKGKVQGELLGAIHFKGAGLSEPAIQANLKGALKLVYTNADLRLVGGWTRTVITPIAMLIGLPELLQSPIHEVRGEIAVADQKLDIQSLNVLGEAFQLKTRGRVVLADLLERSPVDLPVEFYLKRSIAKRAHLIPEGSPPGASFVKLPDFVRLTGTLGKVKAKTDKLMISGLLVRSAVNLPIKLGGQTLDTIKGVGGLLSGRTRTKPSGVSSSEKTDDAVRQVRDAAEGLFKQLLGPRSKKDGGGKKR